VFSPLSQNGDFRNSEGIAGSNLNLTIPNSSSGAELLQISCLNTTGNSGRDIAVSDSHVNQIQYSFVNNVNNVDSYYYDESYYASSSASSSSNSQEQLTIKQRKDLYTSEIIIHLINGYVESAKSSLKNLLKTRREDANNYYRKYGYFDTGHKGYINRCQKELDKLKSDPSDNNIHKIICYFANSDHCNEEARRHFNDYQNLGTYDSYDYDYENDPMGRDCPYDDSHIDVCTFSFAPSPPIIQPQVCTFSFAPQPPIIQPQVCTFSFVSPLTHVELMDLDANDEIDDLCSLIRKISLDDETDYDDF
jgi:hypothetical protein